MNKAIRMKLYTAVYCAFGTAALGTLTAPAGAAEEAVPSKTVRFDDLDITKPAGAKVLYRRIQAAAQEVCQIVPMTREMQLMSIEHACIVRAIDNAVRKVNAPALTELRFGSGLRLASK